MKAIILLAIISLSFAHNLRGVAQDAQKVADFIANHQKVIEEAVNTTVSIANDLSENGFFNLKKIADKVGHFVSKNKDTLEAGAQTVGDIVSGNYQGAVDNGINTVADATHQNQLFNLKKIAQQVGQFVDQNKNTIEAGAQTVGDVVSGNYIGAVDSGIKTVGDATSNNQFSKFSKIADKVGHFVSENKNTIEAGAQTVGDVISGNYEGAVDSGVNTVVDTTSNNQLFNLGKVAKQVGQFVDQNKNTIEAGAQTVGDVISGNYEGAVDSGVNTVVDATSNNQFSKFSKIADKVGHFVSENKNTIEAGAQTVGDVVSGNYVGAVNSGIKTVDDATHQDQLFNLKKITQQVGQFVDQNKNTIEAGAQTVGDVVSGNYIGAVDSGIKTVGDATSNNQFSKFSKIADKVGHFVSENKNTIEAGAQTVGDVISGNYVGAVDSGIKTVGDATHQNELFNLGKVAKQVGQFVDQNKNTIEAGAQTVGDVISGNYEGAVDSGVNTVVDATSNNQFSKFSKIADKVGHFVSKNKNTIEEGAQIAGAVGIL